MDIVGHEKIIQSLKRAIENDKISHSYLFQGPEAIGKKKVAYEFAKTLLCKRRGLEPCNECSSCIKFDSSNHPDFYLVEAEKNTIKKSQIEEAIKSMMLKPLEGNRKIYIIDDSFKLRKEAQNAFLKTLEEPPSYVNIILISTSSENILPTILSRCEVINFIPVEKEKIVKVLIEKYGKKTEEAEFISSFSRGSIGRAIELCRNEEFFNLREKTIETIDEIVKGDRLKVFSDISFFEANKNSIDEILDIILYWFRDLFIYKETNSTDLIINRDKMEILSSQKFLSKDKINDIMEYIMVTKRNIDLRLNYQLSIETMLLKMQEV
ncbi:DNA polymerase III subunit delta' [Sporanaerobacter acetigenes]|uniref:DNA polymerase III subunit delta' n=1 Tax=Sporanaerobacter acetigenes DSM 13106 TaxID=1123281 RepID=A0A1M5VNL2_9FIRM|nr:DNA polymerase III subunit delta' [Sporanaerobacter acetigenes]SHH76748.1 DNA polymerase-3 subunit delta' [Sporanaerobacter acetigenes DSM 13106]